LRLKFLKIFWFFVIFGLNASALQIREERGENRDKKPTAWYDVTANTWQTRTSCLRDSIQTLSLLFDKTALSENSCVNLLMLHYTWPKRGTNFSTGLRRSPTEPMPLELRIAVRHGAPLDKKVMSV
jgi:hypothetical protein